MQDYKDTIIENVPYLRRYARALTDNGRLADRMVHQCIDCAADLHLLTKKEQGNAIDQKVWLFSIFHNIYSEFIAEQHIITAQLSTAGLSDDEEIAVNRESDKYHRAFLQLPLQQKQIFLLVSVEKFSYEEVSKIVNLPLGAILSLLHTARNFIAEQVYSKQAADGSVVDARHSIKPATEKDEAVEMSL
jgi:RNA polymerase sigma-70 factor (ECF subfamily)